MKKRNLIIGGSLLLGIGAVLAFKMRRTIPKNAIAVKPFDIEKYMGKWYELARMDYWFERNVSFAIAEYSLSKDGSVKVVNRGYDRKKQRMVGSVGKAKFVDSHYEAKLQVSFFGPIYAGYNVVALDPDYKYALVAGRNLNYLWILSREQSIPDDVKEEFLRKAEEIGYDTSKLIWTEY